MIRTYQNLQKKMKLWQRILIRNKNNIKIWFCFIKADIKIGRRTSNKTIESEGGKM